MAVQPKTRAREPLPARPGAALSPALRDTISAFFWSRVVVWVAGLAALAAFGRDPGTEGFDPRRLTEPFRNNVQDTLLAPAARWDAVWFLDVAERGYDGARAAFFPLYPLLTKAASYLTGSLALGGALVSVACALVGLACVHRLAALELGPESARPAVAALAFFPSALFLSAIYSEALFLALSAGAFLAAREDRWWLAGMCGFGAAATRSIGLLLVVPLLLLYLYGPVRIGRPRGLRRALKPRRPIRFDVLWLLAIPLGLAAYVGFLALSGEDASAPFKAQDVWFREFAGPLGALPQAAEATVDGVRQLLSGARTPVYFEQAGGDPFEVARRNLTDVVFLVFALVAFVGVLRRLPLAYGVWVAVALAVPLSYPVGPEPLMSVSRFVLVLFPLHMWLGAWAAQRGRTDRVLAVSGGGLALLSSLFACWIWVA